jgi:putative methyltransferase (TIGR04325 family)
MPSLLRRVGRFGKNWLGRCHGVYETSEQVHAHLPRNRKIGHDHSEAAVLYIDRPLVARPSDYPAMFWMRPMLNDTSRVFDWGGNLGHSYLTFRRYFEIPKHLHWTVCDLPAVIAKGREYVQDKNAAHLHFTSSLDDAAGHDIFLSCGALQYWYESFAGWLKKLPSLPAHLLINRIPVWEGKTYFTLEDIKAVVNPYLIRNRSEFVDSLTTIGYELVDSWPCLESTVRIRLRPSRHISAYAGFYFRLKP